MTINSDGSANFPGTGGSNKAYLETTTDNGGEPSFTVSFWFKTLDFTQGSFQGLFSNNSGGSGTSFSWQVDLNGSDIRLVSQQGVAITGSTAGYLTDTWYHVVVRKVATAETEFYVSQLGAGSVSLVGEDKGNGQNIGGLQFLRLGVNRADDSLAQMDMSNVKVYDDASVDLGVLLAEGPQLIPEPSSVLFLAGGLVMGGMYRRRQR
ncbi:LamG-like jellyroll fold domain-containing protein [Rubritalea tangerina]|uniref:LamG-like jellyroll fold domain-containing protein n=1 Tax=Rubritalea tangerina TaxID=430798 RepID=UPI003617AFAA